MNNEQSAIELLREFDLDKEEARLYLSLTENPNTHLQLARITGINRTKVYRLVDQLEKRGLVLRRTDDRGMFLMANDPRALEAQVVMLEEKTRRQHQALGRLIPQLATLREEATHPFAVHAYEGIEGFKQMQWHELEARTEVLVFGNVTVEQLVGNHYWAEKFRSLTASHGSITREIFNQPHETPNFTLNQDFMSKYSARFVPRSELPMNTPMVIYNDTVAVYQFENNKRVGAEIINSSYATTMRVIFEHYWRLGKVLE